MTTYSLRQSQPLTIRDCAGFEQEHRVFIIRDTAGLPENISLLAPPPYCPEINPVENVWQFLIIRRFRRAAFGL